MYNYRKRANIETEYHDLTVLKSGSSMRQRYFYLLLGTCLGDLMMWGLTSQPFPYLVRALFYASIGLHAPESFVVTTGIVSLWQLFFITGIFGADLVLLIPLGLLYRHLSTLADITRPLLGGLVFGAIVSQGLFDSWLTGGSFDQIGLLYAFLTAVVLVYLVPGSQGSRSSR